MKDNKKSTSPLAKGQFWKLGDMYLQISELGKLLVHYRMMKQPGKRGARRHSIGIDKLEAYLRTNKALLVPVPLV
jgi:hypothetical protein